MNKTSRTAAIAITFFAILHLAGFLLASPIFGLEDGDNPASSLEFIKQHSDLWFFSGLASVLAAIALAFAAHAIADTILRPFSSSLPKTVTTFGLFAAAFFFAHGVMRLQSPGTLLYIDSLNHDWGLSAYLAVQMAGVQGLGSARRRCRASAR